MKTIENNIRLNKTELPKKCTVLFIVVYSFSKPNLLKKRRKNFIFLLLKFYRTTIKLNILIFKTAPTLFKNPNKNN